MAFMAAPWAFRGGIIVGSFLPDLLLPDNPDSLSEIASGPILVIASAAKQSRLFPQDGLWIASWSLSSGRASRGPGGSQ
jgi:hypothetical protein